MKSLAWLTDIHLNFLSPPAQEAFIAGLAQTDADAFLLGGDIGEADDVGDHLEAFSGLGKPVYFVLGNHDFYHGTISGVRAEVRHLACSNLHYLCDAGVVPLTADTCLIGHDGWGDGRLGTYFRSRVILNDWRLIGEFAGLADRERLDVLHALGDEAATHLQAVLPDGLDRFRHIVVLTHVPPFKDACWHEGRISNDEWLPHFTCKAVGDVLAEAMAARPDRQMTVLCGHTHGAGEAQVLPNLRVLTGGAEYGEPKVQRVLEVG